MVPLYKRDKKIKRIVDSQGKLGQWALTTRYTTVIPSSGTRINRFRSEKLNPCSKLFVLIFNFITFFSVVWSNWKKGVRIYCLWIFWYFGFFFIEDWVTLHVELLPDRVGSLIIGWLLCQLKVHKCQLNLDIVVGPSLYQEVCVEH